MLNTNKLLTFPLVIVVASVVLESASLGIRIPLSAATTSNCVELLGSGVPIPTCAFAEKVLKTKKNEK